MNDPKGTGNKALTDLIAFLRSYEPFAQIPPARLTPMLNESRMRFFERGSVVLQPADGPPDRFCIVRQGRIRGERPRLDAEGTDILFEIGEGECFPIRALLERRPTRTMHVAGEDCFVLEIPRSAFVALHDCDEHFRQFCDRGERHLVAAIEAGYRLAAVQGRSGDLSLQVPITRLAAKEPVSCESDISLQQAVAQMHHHGIGSIVVCDDAEHPVGIFTLHDLRRLVAQGDTDFSRPLAAVMSPDPVTLESDGTAMNAALLMAEHRCSHIPIVRDGRLIAVISQRDLFSLQRVDMVKISRECADADSVQALAAQVPQIHRLIDTMLLHGAAATELTRIVTHMNDNIVSRVIELAIGEHPELPPFHWLSFGSEGRREQTLSTDQDNGIVFEAGADEAAIREALLPICRRINEDLAQCGFPLCRGNVMASNPEYSRSRSGWSEHLSRIINRPNPTNILRATILFDMRSLGSGPDIASELLEEATPQIRANSLFQRHLAEHALKHRPPLGLLGDLKTTRKDSRKPYVDLKLGGLTPIVDGARVLALSHNISETNTSMRLELLADKGVISATDAEAWSDAKAFVQLHRMRHHQLQAARGLELDNRLDPNDINPLTRRLLREAFRQASRLQRSLRLRYQL